jgi:hypothetical protein
MRDAQKPDHISLNSLLIKLKDGNFVIPDFQREFEWKPWDIKELMRSIFLDYYIGSLLLWKGKKENFDALSCEDVYGFDGKRNPVHIVLDGQQRLTAMYYAFIAPEIPLPSRASQAHYYVHVDKFMAEEYDDAFSYGWQNKRLTEILENRELQYESNIFPLAIIGAGGWDLPKWVMDYEKYWDEKSKRLHEEGDDQGTEIAKNNKANAALFGEHLKGITEQYQISYIELDKDLGVDKVCDIFTQINSKGIRLDAFDLINALLKPKGLQLKHMWRKAASRLEFVETEKMNVYILQVMSILRQNYCSPKYLYFLLPGQKKTIRSADGSRHDKILIKDVNDFEERWNAAVSALENAIKLLRHPQEYGVISSAYLPYVSILPVFSSIQEHIKSLPAEQRLDAQRKTRHWYWASVFTNRYSGAVESTSAGDFISLKAWFADDNLEPALISELKNRFKNLELRKEIRKNTSVYNGIFNLLILLGAQDWMSGHAPMYDDLDDHHIVPKSWGNENLQNNLVDTILNRTPLSSETNRHVIRDRLPNEYLPEMIEKNGERAVRSMMDSHCISKEAIAILMRKPFTPDDFEAFIIERQRTFQVAIENLLIKERLDLPVQLRDLDEQIERVELGLRHLISETLQTNDVDLPQHIAKKAEERIQRAARKNATYDSDRYKDIDGKLEFSDLRELQDIFCSKESWKYFQQRFTTKELLIAKFGQLAELRNVIRHSRSADEITRKEGEAAILWFQTMLEKQTASIE